MTKKAVKEKTIDKKTKEKDKKAKKVAAEGATRRISDLYIYAGLVLIFLFSLYLRAIKPMTRVFVGDTVLFNGNDPWYHMLLAKSTVLNLQRPWFDPMIIFPQGTAIHYGPFNSWGIAIISYIVGLGSPSVHTVEVVGAIFPAVIGALVIFPVYFIGREICGRSGGLLAAAMIAILPGPFFARTVIGFTDHHAAEVLLSTTMILFFMLAARTGRNKLTFTALRQGEWARLKKPLIYSALAGLFLGLYLDAWGPGHLFIGIVLVFATIQSAVDHLRGRSVEYLGISGSIAFFIAMLMVLPFVRTEHGFSTALYSLFQPTILILGILSFLALSLTSTYLAKKGMERYYFPAFIVGFIVVAFLVIYVAAPQFTSPLMHGLNIFQPKTGGAATVAEISPIRDRAMGVMSSFPGILPSASGFPFSPFWMFLLALPLILYRYYKGDSRAADMLLLVWSVTILALTDAQIRFAYYYAVNVALLSGYLGSRLLELTKFYEFEDSLIRMAGGSPKEDLDITKTLTNVLAVVALVLLFIYPGLFGPLGSASIGGTYHSERYVDPIPPDWYDSMVWLHNSTPYPGLDIYTIYEHPPDGEKFAYPDDAYGVMSWWDYGFWIEAIGHRPANANPFQQGIGNKTSGVPGSSPFFLAQNEEEAEAVLAKLDDNRSLYSNTRYVVTDLPMAVNKFHAIAAWSGEPINRYYGGIPQGKTYVQVYMPTYSETMVARLHFFDGTETPVSEAWAISIKPNGRVEPKKFSTNYAELLESVNESLQEGYAAEVVTTSPASTAVPLEALKHYRLVHESQTSVTSSGQKWVKIFEHVPGARITGAAPNGTEVIISVPVTTNEGRTFIYKQTAISDGNFNLVVPYATEGPKEGGTSFDTKPSGPYRMVVDNLQYEVRVPEKMVMTGGTMRI